jgi:hypothetical protein
MERRTARRALARAVTVSAVATAGMVLLSGTGQPVTAQPHSSWQAVAPPPLSSRADALGVRVGHRVLLLGGRDTADVALGDGAAYDVQTGRWRHLPTPVGLSSADRAAAAAGVVVVRHAAQGGASWWAFDPTPGTWTRLRGVPTGAQAPTAFGSEVYAVAGPHVVVFSVAIDRWTALPADPLRPALRHRKVTAGRHGTVVTGRAGPVRAADTWDGTRWRRTAADLPAAGTATLLPAGVDRSTATAVRLGGRVLVLAGGHAWIHSP